MFTQSVPAPAPAPSSTGLHVASTTSSSSPASPTSRTSRLRGLSYLRSYTQSHLLNREHSSGVHSTADAGGASIVPHSTPQSPNSTPGNGTNSTNGTSLVRSESYPSRTTSSSGVLVSTAQPSLDDRDSDTPAAPAVPLVPSIPSHTSTPPASMARSRSATEAGTGTAVSAVSAVSAISAAVESGPTVGLSTDTPVTNMDNLPSIRFSTFYDPRSTRPSLKFATTSRTLPTGKEIIRVGRYSDRDSLPAANPNVPSAAHVGFKSKVVSRRHCEFWYENNHWYIKDVKSSSGTFLNHIRLSQPGTESKPFPINDGDIVQLGIDFKGGEEMIFRCVKIRIELNRGWQNKLNAFNLNTHKRLRDMTRANESGSTQSSQDCSICLNSIAPCQSLFVAPCSHTWHYKCVRSLLDSPQYPSFICPNCRAAVDLEADVEDPPEEWEHMETEEAFENVPETVEHAHARAHTPAVSMTAAPTVVPAAVPVATAAVPSVPSVHPSTSTSTSPLLADTTAQDDPMQIDSAPLPPLPPLPPALHSSPERRISSPHATSPPVPIPASASGAVTSGAARQTQTPSPIAGQAIHPHEGPITPRNDAGPWVFDGSGIRVGGSRPSTDSRHGEMCSLDTAAAELAGRAHN